MTQLNPPEPIYVTRPSLPPLEDYHALMEGVWQRAWLTNDGQFHAELQEKIAQYLDVDHFSLFCNGTLALMVALQMLRINSGEVITTPFTFAATPHVLYWSHVKPVFCDIDPKTYNLDPARIEDLITPDTQAILPVHVYGTPCDIDAIQSIADRHGLRVIYDAAHTFGARYHGKALSAYGDAAILSFHATKLFTTGEGGALVVKTQAQQDRVKSLKNFGIADETTVIGPGINGKMNEFQAALGLLQLKHVADEIQSRSIIDGVYREELSDVDGITVLKETADTERNYAYFPILVNEAAFGNSRDALHDALKEHNVFTRKYFYPLCSHYPCYSGLHSANPDNLPVAERVASQVLCLPIYGQLDPDIARQIGCFTRDYAHRR